VISNKEILKKIKSISPISQSAVQILKLTSGPDYSLREIVQTIECDSILTANILKVANSASFSPKNIITSIDMAVSFLGERIVVSTALNVCGKQFFNTPLEGYEAEKGELWSHSLQTAIAARCLAQKSKAQQIINANLAFTGGILHDIGKVVLSSILKGTAGKFLAEIEAHELEDYLAAERANLGSDHCEAGFALAEHWKLPEPYREIIRMHHTPKDATPEVMPLCYAVHVADIIAMMTGSGTGSDCMQYRLDPGYSEYFDLESDELSKIILTVDSEYKKIESALRS